MTEQKSRPSILRDLLRNWPGFLISLVLLIAVFWYADTSVLIEAIRLAEYLYFIPAFLVFFGAIGLRAMAWRTLLMDRVSIGRTFMTLNEGYLLNNILPFRLGEVGRAFLMSRTAKLGFFQVASTILIERAIDMIMVVGLLLTTLPLVIGVDWARPTAVIVGIGVGSGLLTLYLVARFQKSILNWFARMQEERALFARVNLESLESFFSGLVVLTDFWRFLRFIGLMVATWAMIVLHYYLILIAFEPSGQIYWAAFGIGVVGLGVAIPSAPGSIGVVQGAIVGVFPLAFGIDPGIALAYALTVHGLYLIVTSAVGLFGLVLDGESLSDVYHDIRGAARRLRTGKAETA
jgi:hypothetical protein